MSRKVCIYTRVSDVSQLEGSGLSGQESTCREWATRNDMEVERVFSDGGFSGKLRSRPDLDRMIQYLEEKNKKFTTIELVLVDDFDRIVRDVQGWWEIKLRIELAGAKIFSLKQDLNDTPEGKMLQSITMATKQYERENNGRRVRDRQIARLKDGYRTFKQFPGYMYIKDPTRGGKILVPKQPDFDIIKEALTLFGNGVLVNAKALQKLLNDRGVQSVEKGQIYLSLAQRLLTPKFLDHCLGYITYKPWGIDKLPGKHPRMLNESIVEKILDRVNPKKCYKDCSSGEISEQLPLRSVLKCEICGHPITGAPSKNRLGNIYYYYICRNKCKCSLYGKSFGNKKVHESLETYLASLSLNDQWYTTYHYMFQQIWDNRKSLAEDKILGKKQHLQEIGTELEKIQERLFKTEDNKLISIYEKKLKELSDEQEALTFSIAAFDTEVEGTNPVQTLERGKKYFQNPRLVRASGNLKEKRLFLKALFGENLYYNKKTGIQTLGKPVLYTDNTIFIGCNSYMVGDIGLEPMTPCL